MSFTLQSRLSIDSNRSPSGAATASTRAERERLADREEVLLVERDERDEDRRRRAEREALPRLARARSCGAIRCRPSSRPPT